MIDIFSEINPRTQAEDTFWGTLFLGPWVAAPCLFRQRKLLHGWCPGGGRPISNWHGFRRAPSRPPEGLGFQKLLHSSCPKITTQLLCSEEPIHSWCVAKITTQLMSGGWSTQKRLTWLSSRTSAITWGFRVLIVTTQLMSENYYLVDGIYCTVDV